MINGITIGCQSVFQSVRPAVIMSKNRSWEGKTAVKLESTLRDLDRGHRRFLVKHKRFISCYQNNRTRMESKVIFSL